MGIRLRALFVLLVAPLACTLASAGAVDTSFAALDRNGDGVLVQDEFPAGHDLATDLFSAFDTDNDQRLTPAEYRLYASNANQSVDESAEIEEDE